MVAMTMSMRVARNGTRLRAGPTSCFRCGRSPTCFAASFWQHWPWRTERARSSVIPKARMALGGIGNASSTGPIGWCTPKRHWAARLRCWSTSRATRTARPSAASGGFGTERELIEADRDSANDARRALQAELEQSQIAGATLALELEAQSQALAGLRQQLAELATALELANSQAQEARTRLDGQKQAHASEFSALTAEIDKIRVSHDRALTKSDGDRNFVMLQLDAARTVERDLREQLKRVLGEKDIAEERHRRDVNNLRDAHGAAVLSAAESKAVITPLCERLAAALKRTQDLEQRFDARLNRKAKATISQGSVLL